MHAFRHRLAFWPRARSIRRTQLRLGGIDSAIGTAARGEFVDLVEAGIIDPTKVVRVALENAVSVAGTLLLTDATLTDLPEPKREAMRNEELQEV